MVERLLLDRITLHTGNVAEWHAQLAVLVEAHAANAVVPGGDEAAVAAGDAANPVSLGLPQRTDGGVTAKHIGQRLAGWARFRRCGGWRGINFPPRVWSYILHTGQRDRLRQCCVVGARCQSCYARFTRPPAVLGGGLSFSSRFFIDLAAAPANMRVLILHLI